MNTDLIPKMRVEELFDALNCIEGLCSGAYTDRELLCLLPIPRNVVTDDSRGAEGAWATCGDAAWMMRVLMALHHLGRISRQTISLASCAVARTVQEFVPYRARVQWMNAALDAVEEWARCESIAPQQEAQLKDAQGKMFVLCDLARACVCAHEKMMNFNYRYALHLEDDAAYHAVLSASAVVAMAASPVEAIFDAKAANLHAKRAFKCHDACSHLLRVGSLISEEGEDAAEDTASHVRADAIRAAIPWTTVEAALREAMATAV